MTWNMSDNPVTPGTIAGLCPMGCGETLHVGDGGHIVCHGEDCPHPKAVDVLLHQPSDHHVVFSSTGFVVEHPLSERITQTMASCSLMGDLVALDGMPVAAPGRYRVIKHEPDGDSESYRSDSFGWHFERAD